MGVALWSRPSGTRRLRDSPATHAAVPHLLQLAIEHERARGLHEHKVRGDLQLVAWGACETLSLKATQTIRWRFDYQS